MRHEPSTPERRSRPIPRPRKLTVRLRAEELDELTAVAEAYGLVGVDELAAQVLVDFLHRRRDLGADAPASR